MLREIPPVVALTFALGAAPAFAQSAPAPASPAEGSTAARTLEQNRRVLVGQPASSEVPRGMATEPVARNDGAGPAPAGGAGRRS